MEINRAKELKNKTTILENTLEKFNLKIIQFAFRKYEEDDYDAELIVELQSIKGDKIPESADIKINLYDEAGDIFLTKSYTISKTQFAIYDTYRIPLYDDCKLLLRAKSAKIFMTKADY